METGTTRGPHRSDEKDATNRPDIARKSCVPVVQAPARDGSAAATSETMNESTTNPQKGTEDTNRTGTDDVAPVTVRRGVSRGEVIGRDPAAEDDQRVATDGGQDVEAVDFSVNHEELMRHELIDINAAYNALDDYYTGHTDGHVTMAEGGRCLVVITQNRRFKHFQTFQQENALRIANVTAVTTEEDGGATEANEPRLKVEIKAAEGVTA